MPCPHGPRPTGWWRPTAPCSTSMCGRCCGASMPRSTQAWWGLSRRQCPTFPSWRPPTTPSTSSKRSQPRPSLRPLSPSPCRRVSRRQPRQGRRKPHRTDGGPRRARLKAPNPNPGLASASAAAASAASAATAALGAAAKRSAAGASPRRRAAAAAATSIPHAPWTAARSQGAVTGSAASSPPGGAAADGGPGRETGEETVAVEGNHQVGRGCPRHPGDRRRIMAVACQAWWPARLRPRAARRQNVEQECANHYRSERSAEPEGRPPARPLLTRPPKLYLRT